MFNLKEFQDGIPAVDRNKNLYYYIGLNPIRKGTAAELVGTTTETINCWSVDGRYTSTSKPSR